MLKKRFFLLLSSPEGKYFIGSFLCGVFLVLLSIVFSVYLTRQQILVHTQSQEIESRIAAYHDSITHALQLRKQIRAYSRYLDPVCEGGDAHATGLIEVLTTPLSIQGVVTSSTLDTATSTPNPTSSKKTTPASPLETVTTNATLAGPYADIAQFIYDKNISSSDASSLIIQSWTRSSSQNTQVATPASAEQIPKMDQDITSATILIQTNQISRDFCRTIGTLKALRR